MTTTIDTLAVNVVTSLRCNGPATRDQLRASLRHAHPIDTYPHLLDRALQKAKRDGLIEHSKVGEDRRSYWRLVERHPARKAGIEEARELLEGPLHYHVKSRVEVAHEQGFDDGQQHAFQLVADTIRSKIAADAKIGCSPSVDDLSEWADEIETGAWAEEEASDE